MAGAWNNRKGREAENDVCRYLNEDHGLFTERRSLKSAGDDRGDVIGVLGCTIQVKAWKRRCVPQWTRELVEQMSRNKDTVGLLVWKPNGSPRLAGHTTWQWFVVETLDGSSLTIGPLDGATAVTKVRDMLGA